MLVLSRKNHESVVVGGAGGFHRLLKVTVIAIQGKNVKLGFEVDGDVLVHRSEVWERIQAGQRLDCKSDSGVARQQMPETRRGKSDHEASDYRVFVDAICQEGNPNAESSLKRGRDDKRQTEVGNRPENR